MTLLEMWYLELEIFQAEFIKLFVGLYYTHPYVIHFWGNN